MITAAYDVINDDASLNDYSRVLNRCVTHAILQNVSLEDRKPPSA